MNTEPGDVSAYIVATLALFVFVGRAARSRATTADRLAVVVFVCSFSIAWIAESFFMPIGSGTDAGDFHRAAVAQAEGGSLALGVGSSAYVAWLTIWYYVFGASSLLGSVLSAVALATAVLVIARIGELAHARGASAFAVGLFALSPATLFFCSPTMREAYQVLFFSLSVLLILRWHLESSTSALIGGLVAGLCMALLHNGLVVIWALTLPCCVLWSVNSGALRPARGRKEFRLIGIFVAILVLTAGGSFILQSIARMEGAVALKSLYSGEALEYTKGYREGALETARAHYGGSLDMSSPLLAFTTSLTAYSFYIQPWIRSGLS